MPSIKGTASVSDARARTKELKSTKFPKMFSKPVAVEKLNKPVFSQWIEQKVASILGFDDEIVSSTAINLFLPENDGEPSSSAPDPRRAQLDLAGFLGDEESAKFAKELWALMIEAAENGVGIPTTLLEEKKKELAEQKMKAMADRRPKDQRFNAEPRHQQQHLPPPRMDQFVQEAARRADMARQAIGVEGGRVNRWGNRQVAPVGPVPVPVSPPHPPEQDGGRAPISNVANGGSNRGTSEGDDRKLPPADAEVSAVDQFGRAVPQLYRTHTQTSRDASQRRPHDQERYRPPARSYEEARGGRRGSSRSRSRDSGDRVRSGGRDTDRRRDYDARGRRDDDRRRFDHDRRRSDGGDRQDRHDRHDHHDHHYNRHHDRHRSQRDHYDRDYRRERPHDKAREIDELERRLSLLEKQSARRKGNNPKLEDEIEDTKDRIYELERSRRKRVRARERDDDSHRRRRDRCTASPDGRRRRSGSRSPPPKRRQGGREKDDSSGSEKSSHSSRSRRSSSDGESDSDSGRSESRSSTGSRSRSHSGSPSDDSRRGKNRVDTNDAGDRHGRNRSRSGSVKR